MFQEKLESKFSQGCKDLDFSKDTKSKVLFFSFTVILAVGLLPVPVSLEYKNPLINEINDIYMKIPGGTFDITEKIKG